MVHLDRSIPKAGNAESIKDKAIQSERKAIHLLSLKRKTDWIVRTSVPSLGKPSRKETKKDLSKAGA